MRKLLNNIFFNPIFVLGRRGLSGDLFFFIFFLSLFSFFTFLYSLGRVGSFEHENPKGGRCFGGPRIAGVLRCFCVIYLPL